MPRSCLVDTGVLLVAEGMAEQASATCVAECAKMLREIERDGVLVLDQGRRILEEYQNKLGTRGQLKPGALFLLWVLRNLGRPARVDATIDIHEIANEPGLAEFPVDSALSAFDRSDRKFVAMSRAHPAHPPILVSVDTDWADAKADLARHEVVVEELCPGDMEHLRARKMKKRHRR